MGEELAGRLGGRDGLAYGATFLFGLCMYSSVVNLFPALDALRPALLTSGVAAGAFVLRRVMQREHVGLDGMRGIALVALCVLAFVSESWSVFPKGTHDYAVELTKDAAICLVIAQVVTNTARLKAILCVCLVGGLAPAWYSFQNYMNGTNLIDGGRARWEGIYLDPNHMAMALVFLVPVAITLMLRGRGLWRVLGAVSVLGSLTGIAVSASRGGALGLSLTCLIWAAREKQRARTLSLFAVVLLLFLAFSPKSFWNRTQTITDYQQDASAMGRVHAWQVGRAISEDKPLLGAGAGAFLYAWPLYAPVEARGEAFVAHNIFLAMIGELGWVGFFLFLLFVASALAEGYRAGDSPAGGPWIRATFAGACGYVLCDMSSGYVTSAHFFFIFGLLAAAGRIRAYEQAVLAGNVAEPEPETTLAEGTA